MTPSLLPADSISQQQSAAGFGGEAASNPPASLEAPSSWRSPTYCVVAHTDAPREALLRAIDDLTRLQWQLGVFDGEFESTDELVTQVLRIRGTLAGIVRHVP